MKFVIAGLLIITILPGNAGEKYEGGIRYSYELKSAQPSGEHISNGEITEVSAISDTNITAPDSSSQKFKVITKNFREISPSGRSFNFFISIQ